MALIGALAVGFIASGIAGAYAGVALLPRRAFGDLRPTVQFAAAKKAGAAVRATASSARKYCRILYGRASDLSSLLAEKKANALLAKLIEFYRGCLVLAPRSKKPFAWATAENDLAILLQWLGERKGGRSRLEEAVAAYREALKDWTRARTPVRWAATKCNLGRALATLGEWDSGRSRLEEAIAAYRGALKECTRVRAPHCWAATQNNLGTALRMQGERAAVRPS